MCILQYQERKRERERERERERVHRIWIDLLFIVYLLGVELRITEAYKYKYIYGVSQKIPIDMYSMIENHYLFFSGGPGDCLL